MNLNEFEGKYGELPLVTAEELYEDAPCGYFSFVGDGTIVMINKTLLTWLGYERSEIVFIRKFQSLLSIGGKMFFETHFSPMIRMQGSVKEINLDLVRKDKSLLPILINVNKVDASQHDQIVYRATVFDITDRKQYEKDILEARKKAEASSIAKAEFLATVSHEIRTPLNAIAGIANLIQHTPLNDKQKEYVRILKLSSDGLMALLNSVLDLSKLEKGGLKLEERVFSIKDVALTLAHTIGIEATEKGIALQLNLDQDLPDYFIGDPLKLTQILNNLLGNAVKFTQTGYVRLNINRVSGVADRHSLQFSIQDTGIGIPKDKLKSIFEEFTQASYEVNLNYGGTGLGLTISQKLLQLHGSSIEVTSEVGKGSEFSFLLDYGVYSETPAVEAAMLTDIQHNSFDNLRVLVVDDAQINLTIASEYMKSWAILCDVAKSGAQALSLIEAGNYDIILMDLHMPELNGFKATELIRQMKLPKRPSIIALSASANEHSAETLRLAGFDNWLAKPFQPSDLLQIFHERINELDRQPGVFKPVEASHNQILDKAEQAAEKLTEKPCFDLSFYHQLTKESGGSLQEIVTITIASFERFRDQFLLALQQRDINTFAELVHKSAIPLHYIQAKELENCIMTVKATLEQEAVDTILLRDQTDELAINFNKVIEGLKAVNESDH